MSAETKNPIFILESGEKDEKTELDQIPIELEKLNNLPSNSQAITATKATLLDKVKDFSQVFCPSQTGRDGGNCGGGGGDVPEFKSTPICMMTKPLNLIFYIETSHNSRDYQFQFYWHMISARVFI